MLEIINMKLILLFCASVILVNGRKGFGPTDQEWGTVTVREGAHLFWWLHYTTATTKPTDKPLIIWLQGGPGLSSTLHGNFEEIGPLDFNLNPRNITWVNYANVMFVDNPVGTGFSYVDKLEYATNNKQIAKDFVVLLQQFYKDLPQFEDVPLYIFGETYGGKMTAEIALHLHQAIENGSIKSNFRGIGLGGPWISPIDSVLTWAPYLYNLGFLDTFEYNNVNERALEVKSMVDNGWWREATLEVAGLENYIDMFTYYVNFQNVLKSTNQLDENPPKKSGISTLGTDSTTFMNSKVKPALNLTQNWFPRNTTIVDHLYLDYMKPVTHIVERLLNETDLTVAVYNGQLNLGTNIIGTENWVNRLHFKGSEHWSEDTKIAFRINKRYEGFKKKAGNLKFYWILRAGTRVPLDNPQAMSYVLKEVTKNSKK